LRLAAGCGKPSPDASAMQANGGIVLIDLATGHLMRQWSYGPNETAQVWPEGPSAYLSANGAQLVVPVFQKNGPPDLTVRMLATNAPSGTLDSASHVAWHETLTSGQSFAVAEDQAFSAPARSPVAA